MTCPEHQVSYNSIFFPVGRASRASDRSDKQVMLVVISQSTATQDKLEQQLRDITQVSYSLEHSAAAKCAWHRNAITEHRRRFCFVASPMEIQQLLQRIVLLKSPIQVKTSFGVFFYIVFVQSNLSKIYFKDILRPTGNPHIYIVYSI